MIGFVFMPPPFSMRGAYGITAACMYVRPIRNTNGFHVISFERIGVLHRNFIHRYIIIKCRSSSILGKIHQLLWELWPIFKFEKFSTLRNGFRAISFERIGVSDSNFIHRYIILKCRSSSI